MLSKLFVCGTIFLVLFVVYAQSTGHGESGPIIIKTAGKRGRNDLLMVGGQTKCGHGPTIFKDGSRKRKRGSDLVFLPGQNHCHEKKVEYVPVPYKEEKSYGMDLGGYGGQMGGYDRR